MKSIKLLLLAAPLLLMPISSSAGLLERFIGDDLKIDDFDETLPSVPEPSGALVMGVALATVVLAQRRLRK